jgi:hypothetical protein
VKFYIQALENRVADLEILLNERGDGTGPGEQWVRTSEEPVEAEQSEFQPLLNAVRDLSLDVAGSYVGGASTITLGRALQTALAGKTNLILPGMGTEQGRKRLESFTSDFSSIPENRACQIDPGTADKMVHAYLKHLCVNFPIMFTFDIIALHERRYCLDNIYDESVLNLIYGLGAHFMEKVIRPATYRLLRCLTGGQTGESTGTYNPEAFYNVALDNRETILRLGDTRTLTYLLLLGQHCVRMPKDPGAW